jgi:hypothetical protein
MTTAIIVTLDAQPFLQISRACLTTLSSIFPRGGTLGPRDTTNEA